MKLFLKILTLVVGIICNVWGIASLLQTIDIINLPFLGYLDKLAEIHILYSYIIVIATMIVGIMSLNVFAGLCKGYVKNVLSISLCTYSTVMTVPLLGAFVLFFLAKFNISTVPFLDNMVTTIYQDLTTIFTTDIWQYVIFSGGIVMSIVFLIVPIIMCVTTVKGKKAKKED